MALMTPSVVILDIRPESRAIAPYVSETNSDKGIRMTVPKMINPPHPEAQDPFFFVVTFAIIHLLRVG
jgi:hypothetical protein